MLMSTTLTIITVSIFSVAVMDVWQRLYHRLGGLPPTNWAMVGRWLLATVNTHKIFGHQLQKITPYPRETMIGWVFHYLIGMMYVIAYIALWKNVGILTPTFLDGLIFGIVSVAVPWFFFMPTMGAGVLGSKTPRPVLACLSALGVHAVFGVAIALSLQLSQ
ncbi:DUF2938 family protein [Octadecabacter arcticus]|uniref:DUF2938 family protein n=1 Tax=Octadecabacter arcticus TaxID=53946 RepID=UPI00068536BD|nr:DUF2938 family protein [Octadecabacter arcticus]